MRANAPAYAASSRNLVTKSGFRRLRVSTAAELIVYAPGSHMIAGVQYHAACLVIFETLCVAEQELRLARLRKFWRAAKPAVAWIVCALELVSCFADDAGCQQNIGGG